MRTALVTAFFVAAARQQVAENDGEDEREDHAPVERLAVLIEELAHFVVATRDVHESVSCELEAPDQPGSAQIIPGHTNKFL